MLEHPSTALALLTAISSVAVLIEQSDDGLEPSQTARPSSSSSPATTPVTEILDLCKGPYMNMAHSENQDERFKSLSIDMQQSLFATARLEVISARYHFY